MPALGTKAGAIRNDTIVRCDLKGSWVGALHHSPSLMKAVVSGGRVPMSSSWNLGSCLGLMFWLANQVFRGPHMRDQTSFRGRTPPPEWVPAGHPPGFKKKPARDPQFHGIHWRRLFSPREVT